MYKVIINNKNMLYKDIKIKKEKDTNNLFSACSVFWAFSDKQWEENKTPKLENEKYVSIGGGGYLPKHKVDDLIKGMKDIDNTFKKQVKENKAREQHILYELNNHEAFYTTSTETTLDALGDDYTKEEVIEVYKKFKAKKHIVFGLDNQLKKYENSI